MSKKSFPWPKKGDKIFMAGGDDWYNNACLNDLGVGLSWYLYPDGYKCAADLLVEHIMSTHLNHDTFVYPIVFLYRQYIELTLKRLIRDGNELLNISEKLPQGHKINDLWKKCRAILEKVWPNESSEDLDAVEACIKQFSAKDPTSTAFRYPTDLEGYLSLPKMQINLRNLSEVMRRVSSFLESCSIGIYENLNNKREMDEEYNEGWY
ncbi:MAG: hypothetical protein WBC40_10690 [Halobacteriota archaeon]